MRASKQDYEEFVSLVRRLEKGRTKRLMWAIALADILKRSNPLFDKRRFVRAVDIDDTSRSLHGRGGTPQILGDKT